MARIQLPNQVRPVRSAAAVFLCAGLSIALLFLRMGLGGFPIWAWSGIMAMTGPIIFLCACVLVFFRPTLGYVLGGIAAVVALPWFVLTESSSGLPSIWTYLNGPYDFGINYRPYATEKILSVALLAAGVTCSFLRLLPLGLLPTEFSFIPPHVAYDCRFRSCRGSLVAPLGNALDASRHR